MLRRLLLALGFCAVAALPCAAQEAARWRVTLISSTVLWDVALVGLQEDLLLIRQNDSTSAVPLREVTELRRVPPEDEPLADAPRPRFGGGQEQPTLYQFPAWDLAQKRRIIEQILRDQGIGDQPAVVGTPPR